MLDTMKYGTYILFAVFSGLGGLFIWKFVTETKGKLLEELDVVFGDDMNSITEADRLRMQFNESLGLAGLETVEDSRAEKLATAEQVEL